MPLSSFSRLSWQQMKNIHGIRIRIRRKFCHQRVNIRGINDRSSFAFASSMGKIFRSFYFGWLHCSRINFPQANDFQLKRIAQAMFGSLHIYYHPFCTVIRKWIVYIQGWYFFTLYMLKYFLMDARRESFQRRCLGVIFQIRCHKQITTNAELRMLIKIKLLIQNVFITIF